MKSIFLPIALTFSLIVSAQTPNTKPVNQDSINQVKEKEAIKLVNEKMSITSAMIDSTMDKIMSKITAKQFDQYAGAYQFFILELKRYWLEQYYKKEKK